MRLILIAMSLMTLISNAAAAPAQEEGIGAKTVVGNRFPLYLQCFENARDGDIGPEALTPCNQSLEEEGLSQRRTAIAHANRGVIQFNIGDYAAAITDYTTALRLGINVQARILANRGLAHEALGNDALARADYQAALVINPKNATAASRLEELKKPLYDRSKLPRKITVELPTPPSEY